MKELGLRVWRSALSVLAVRIFAVPLMAFVTGSNAAPAPCPQPRETQRAPDAYLNRANPLPPLPVNLKAGERLYFGKGGQHDCASCHGKAGDGDGELAKLFETKPRNLACSQMMQTISDGQLFWIIKYGSPATVMPASARLGDTQIWQIVLYLRQLSQ
jgi:mono/diheme cytochrome c family protein